MNTKVERALNEQIHAEFFSFYLYLSVAAYFTSNHLDGFAHWMRVQAQEEFNHAMKLFDFLNERGGTVELLPRRGGLDVVNELPFDAYLYGLAEVPRSWPTATLEAWPISTSSKPALWLR